MVLSRRWHATMALHSLSYQVVLPEPTQTRSSRHCRRHTTAEYLISLSPHCYVGAVLLPHFRSLHILTMLLVLARWAKAKDRHARRCQHRLGLEVGAVPCFPAPCPINLLIKRLIFGVGPCEYPELLSIRLDMEALRQLLLTFK